MFIQLHPDTLVRDGLTIAPVGENFFFNIDHIGFARFRVSTKHDQGGLGADASKVPEGTSCLELSRSALPNDTAQVALYFPGDLVSEYHRLLRILKDQLV
ncbi:hypothetical protein [Longimicrobium sp.]|uniref:hypothetical protein n=1 Tax=Longimicrobium sp. TaxID=2029185 RepID=UPI003B3B19F3